MLKLATVLLLLAARAALAAPPVTETLDEAHQGRMILTPRGGTLVATGADGTRYRAVFLPDSVLSDEKIRMVPVTAVAGVPFASGTVGAVHFEPEGLLLMRPATLTIEGRASIEAKAVVGFAYDGAGGGLHVRTAQSGEQPPVIVGRMQPGVRLRFPRGAPPNTPNPRAVTLEITHFSSFGAGPAVRGEVNRFVAATLPPDVEDRAMQRIAVAQLACVASPGCDAYDGSIANHDANFSGQVTKALEDWRDALTAELKAVNRTMTTEVDTLSRMGRDVLQWEAQAERFKVREYFNADIAELRGLLETTFGNAEQLLLNSCRKPNTNLSGMVIQMMAIARQAQLIGTSDHFHEEELAACLTFDLKVTSKFVVTSSKGTMRTQYNVDLSLSPTGLGGPPRSTARTGVFSAAQFNVPDCVQVSRAPSVTETSAWLRFTLSPRRAASAGAAPTSPRTVVAPGRGVVALPSTTHTGTFEPPHVVWAPGIPSEGVMLKCKSGEAGPMSLWADVFAKLHANEETQMLARTDMAAAGYELHDVTTNRLYTIDDWQGFPLAGGGALTRDYDRTMPSSDGQGTSTLIETTHLEIRHHPRNSLTNVRGAR